MTANAPIDFYREVQNVLFDIHDLGVLEEKQLRSSFMDMARSIAERVEAQTIERCEFYEDGTLHDIKRLYIPKSDKEEGKL